MWPQVLNNLPLPPDYACVNFTLRETVYRSNEQIVQSDTTWLLLEPIVLSKLPSHYSPAVDRRLTADSELFKRRCVAFYWNREPMFQ